MFFSSFVEILLLSSRSRKGKMRNLCVPSFRPRILMSACSYLKKKSSHEQGYVIQYLYCLKVWCLWVRWRRTGSPSLLTRHGSTRALPWRATTAASPSPTRPSWANTCTRTRNMSAMSAAKNSSGLRLHCVESRDLFFIDQKKVECFLVVRTFLITGNSTVKLKVLVLIEFTARENSFFPQNVYVFFRH